MRKFNYTLAITVLLASILFSCAEEIGDDPNQRDDNFEMPELTLSNTIQFTVNSHVNGFGALYLHGGKIAVDWGDGEITKDIKPQNGSSLRSEFTHVYKTGGSYRVKIWADELTYIHVSSLFHSYEQLHVGNCPALENAMFNSFSKDKSLNLNGCKRLESLNLGNWAELESVTLDECANLYDAFIYTNPNLTALDLSKNSQLTYLRSSDCGIEDLKLPKSIVNVELRGHKVTDITLNDYKELTKLICDNNKNLSTLNLTGCENLSIISFLDTQVETFDFSEFLKLREIHCGNTPMRSIDISKNKSLSALYCKNLDLTSLDITNNKALSILDCSGNKLSDLDVSKSVYFRKLYIQQNEFDKNGLEALFKALPEFKPMELYGTIPNLQVPEIKIFGNPGTASCDTKLITDKGWTIKTN